MAEKIISKRVLFSKGRQRAFLNKIIRKIPIEQIAKICNLSQRTIRDWRRQKFSMDFESLKLLCRKLHLGIPVGIKLKDQYWYAGKGASVGGKAVWKKYGRIGGDAGYRKKRWYEWWERDGKYKPSTFPNLPKPIKKPAFSKELAEFVGIMLGDGSISKYQISITLCSKDEKKYGNFIVKLIKKLFSVPVATLQREKQSTIDLIVSRVSLVSFCVERLGLKQGNKIRQQVDVPKWIKNSMLYSVACLRGLIDTDGTIFRHQYKVNGKLYSYKKLSFTSRSKPLRLSVFAILKRVGLNVRQS